MILRVGPFLYRVKIVPGYIEHEGQRCLGLCDNDHHELWIANVGTQAQQLQVLCHEYMEAWIYHFAPPGSAPGSKDLGSDPSGSERSGSSRQPGIPSDAPPHAHPQPPTAAFALATKETYCDLFGLAMTQFVLDFIHMLREQGVLDDWSLSATLDEARAHEPPRPAAAEPAPPAPRPPSRESPRPRSRRRPPNPPSGKSTKLVRTSAVRGLAICRTLPHEARHWVTVCEPVDQAPGRFWVTRVYDPQTIPEACGA